MSWSVGSTPALPTALHVSWGSSLGLPDDSLAASSPLTTQDKVAVLGLEQEDWKCLEQREARPGSCAALPSTAMHFMVLAGLQGCWRRAHRASSSSRAMSQSDSREVVSWVARAWMLSRAMNGSKPAGNQT